MTTAEKTAPLDAWLDRVEAREAWTALMPNGRSTITGYLINGHIAVAIRYYSHGERKIDGWELLVPASLKNDTTATLDGAALALGVEGCHGLVGG